MNIQPHDTQTIARSLERTTAFRGLSNEDRLYIANRIISRRFEAGETIGDFGDIVDEFWIIGEGYIETYFQNEQGSIEPLATLGPDDHIGELALLEETPRPVRVIARTPVLLLVLPSDSFFEFVDAYPVLMRNLYRTLSRRFKNAIGTQASNRSSKRLGIIARSIKARILASRLISRLAASGEKLVVQTDDANSLSTLPAWPKDIALQHGTRPNDPPKTDSGSLHRQIVVLCKKEIEDLDLSVFQECDEWLWMLQPDESITVEPLLRNSSTVNVTAIDKMRMVWLLSDDQPVAAWLPDPPCKRSSIKVHVSTEQSQLSRLEQQGLDRLVRAIRGYRIGIALSGGGAKGMAHLGVLRALDDAGISFDVMSGASAGAMAGLVYASGIEPLQAAHHFQHDLTPSRIFRSLPGWPNLYLLYQFRRRAWDSMLRPYLRDWRLEQLPIEFHALTVDLVQGRSVVRKTGDAVQAILESINLPVISKPIPRDGMLLVDGGMLDNLPGDVLANDHCDFVVGVDISRKMNCEFAGNCPDTPTQKMKNAGSLATMLRIFESQAHNLGAVRSRSIDFWITPDTSEYGLADFYKSQEIASVGEQAAKKLIPELQRRLSALELRLFQSTPN